MLTVYRRHRPDCRHKAKGRNFLRCSCPLWCDGDLDGRRFRRSLGTTDLEEAQARIRLLESGGLAEEPAAPEPAAGSRQRQNPHAEALQERGLGTVLVQCAEVKPARH